MGTILFVRVITCRTGNHGCVLNTPVAPSLPSVAEKLLLHNPLPPPPTPVPPAEYIVGSDNVPSESAISSSGLHGAHRRVAASSSSLVDVNLTCIISNITSNKYFFSSFNDVDPSHVMLVDCCVLCCQVWAHSGRMMAAAAIDHRSSITFYLAFLSRTHTTTHVQPQTNYLSNQISLPIFGG
jgi:hypothetical protein